jgi:hypothetical protein
MFRVRLNFDERADIQRESISITEKARRSGLSETVSAEMQASFEALLSDLVDTGRLLKVQRSHLVVDRIISGPGYRLNIHFSVNEKLNFVARLLRRLGMK